MAQQTYPIPKTNPNAQMSISFFIIWIANILVIAIANMLLPEQIVLGTMSLSYSMALILSAGVLAWIATLTMPIFTQIEMQKKMVLSPQQWILGYFIINAVAIWVVARFADAIGLGISSWMYVLGLAALIDLIQGMSMMLYGGMQEKK